MRVLVHFTQITVFAVLEPNILVNFVNLIAFFLEVLYSLLWNPTISRIFLVSHCCSIDFFSMNDSHTMWGARPTNLTILMAPTESENALQRSSSKTSITTESSITIDCSVNTIPVIPSTPIIELSIRSSQPTLADDSGRPGSLHTCSEVTLLQTEVQNSVWLWIVCFSTDSIPVSLLLSVHN